MKDSVIQWKFCVYSFILVRLFCCISGSIKEKNTVEEDLMMRLLILITSMRETWNSTESWNVFMGNIQQRLNRIWNVVLLVLALYALVSSCNAAEGFCRKLFIDYIWFYSWCIYHNLTKDFILWVGSLRKRTIVNKERNYNLIKVLMIFLYM